MPRIDWAEEARRNYSKPSLGRWYHHNVRQTKRRARNLFHSLLQTTLVAVLLIYVAAAGIHFANGWELGRIPRGLGQDTSMAIACWHSPGAMWEFVGLTPLEREFVTVFANYRSLC